MRLLYVFLRALPFFILKAVFRVVSLVVYLILTNRRKITQSNIKFAVGGKYKRLAIKTYLYFADMVAFNIKYLQDKKFIREHCEIEGLENYTRAKSEGRGVIFTTAHFGNWELLVCGFAILREPIYVMVRPIDSKIVDEIVESVRSSCGNKIISSRLSSFEFIKLLRKGKVLGILIDQAGGDGSFVVDFFSRKAKVSESIGVFCCRLKVPVLPAYLREKNGKFIITIEKAIYCDTSKSKKEAIQDVMNRIYERFEEWIRNEPYKYFWMHNRWK